MRFLQNGNKLCGQFGRFSSFISMTTLRTIEKMSFKQCNNLALKYIPNIHYCIVIARHVITALSNINEQVMVLKLQEVLLIQYYSQATVWSSSGN